MPTPTEVPEKGLYYHFKHDPNGPVNNYTYEVMGVSQHTETGELSISYRPLYRDPKFEGKDFLNRPLDMFNREVPGRSNGGGTIPRFRKITDPETVRKLLVIRAEMYRVIVVSK